MAMSAAVADAGHRLEKHFEARGIGVKGFEQRLAAAADFVLRLAGAQAFSEVAPVAVETLVGHLENAADVGGLLLVEEEIG